MAGQPRGSTPRASRGGRRGYHHGDVPAAAVAAALAHLRAHGRPDFTLRSIADDLSIAHPSLYNHFQGRDALIDAVATVGFDELASRIERLLAASPDALTVIRAVGHDIVAFAREQPGLYRLMFGPDLMARKAGDARLAAAMETPLRLVADVVQRGAQDGSIRAGDPLLIAAGMWAAAHGLAMLVIDNRLSMLHGDHADALVATTIDAVLRGYAHADAGSTREQPQRLRHP